MGEEFDMNNSRAMFVTSVAEAPRDTYLSSSGWDGGRR